MSSEKTVHPGMPPVEEGAVRQSAVQEATGGRPLMGFLYSVSRTETGEFWPVYAGANTIGRSSECSIRLLEETVSKEHATLVIRPLEKNGARSGLAVFLQDTASMCGTRLNGNTIDYQPHECRSGDVITVGKHYELYFLLLDANALGLAPQEGFKASEDNFGVDNLWTPPPGAYVSRTPKGTLIPESSNPFDSQSAAEQPWQ